MKFCVFWYLFWLNKKNLGHIRTFFKLWSQARKKRRQKSKNVLCKCAIDLNSVFLIFKFVIPYPTVYSVHCTVYVLTNDKWIKDTKFTRMAESMKHDYATLLLLLELAPHHHRQLTKWEWLPPFPLSFCFFSLSMAGRGFVNVN